ncbi:MAG TPA: hypothetical protein VFX23_12105 [Limnobacter sp.]|uniref:hypothetical protein n=1 Tax=Limnobacter sp. TaxID=2003368 RepID=UPI002E33975A|nr:hypothetical protein [Limnobacter sp.]HEX5486725.1 hypothetical protein [Limnobacter sp.]
MKNYLLDLRQKFRPAVPVLSMSVHEHGCRWIYGLARQSGVLSFASIRCSGGAEMEKGSDISGDSLSAELLGGFLDGALQKIGANQFPKPVVAVFSIPSSRAFMCELTAEKNAQEEDLRFQIEDLLSMAAGEQIEEMIYDWQPKLKQENDSAGQNLVVASVMRKLLDEIHLGCKAHHLRCLGVTLDNIAAVNGFLQAADKKDAIGNPRFILYGEICKTKVRLNVFMDGFLCHENQDFSEDGFSVVQSIASLEKLVEIWMRGEPDQGEGNSKLIVGGELMVSKTAMATIKRSRILADKIFEVKPLAQIQEHWFVDVVAYGALEGMPCE